MRKAAKHSGEKYTFRMKTGEGVTKSWLNPDFIYDLDQLFSTFMTFNLLICERV